MLKELLTIFRTDNPLAAMGRNFAEMLGLAYEMMLKAGEMLFGDENTADERTKLHQQDIRVNKLERTIRKQVVAHLSLHSNTHDVPYCLLLMTMVKDVERLGDYAKNISEIGEIHQGPLPKGDILDELMEIRAGVEAAFLSAAEVVESSDTERAIELIEQGRDLAHRCNALLQRIARTEFEPSAVTALVLSTRYYKRVGGHVLNILSSVVMPLHKVDYYDERELSEDDD